MVNAVAVRKSRLLLMLVDALVRRGELRGWDAEVRVVVPHDYA